MPPAAKDGSNFRARRLSVTDPNADDAADQLKNASVGGTSSPAASRSRRMSMSPEMGGKAETTPPFALDAVGTFSCHGVEPGMRQGETNAKINQDRGSVTYPLGKNGDYALFCVFDGHGAKGDKCSQFVNEKVVMKVGAPLDTAVAEDQALIKAFEEADAELKKDKSIDAELSGTTAVAVLYKFAGEKRGIAWSACAGDSRAGYQDLKESSHKDAIKESSHKDPKKGMDLTIDQKPDTPAEMARIRKAGGFVSPPEEEWGGPARVWLDANMTLPGLAMGRSIGDHLVKSVGVIATPEVRKFEFDVKMEEAQSIVLASDGVWEFIDTDAAFGLLNTKKGNATEKVTKLIETAAAKWRQEEGDYRDDITAIYLRLDKIHETHFAK